MITSGYMQSRALRVATVTVLAFTGCTDDEPAGSNLAGSTETSAATSPTPSSSSSPSTTEPVPSAADRPSLPEGLYRTGPVTGEHMRAAVLAAGFDETEVDANFRADTGPIVVGLRLAGGSWTQLYSADGAPEEVGWRGTYEVIDDDTVIATDPCGAITYSYAVAGDVLTLDVHDTTCGEGAVRDMIIQTALFETAPFALAEPTPVEPATDHHYDADAFAVPFTVTVPDWVPAEPSSSSPTFITWEGLQLDRAIRILAPVNIYPPGATSPAAVPDDYRTYLLGLADHGAQITDLDEISVDGHATTVVTISTPVSIDGALGCPEEDMAADDCYGPQPELLLRLAAIDTGDGTILIWIRDNAGDGQRDLEYDSFDTMLASLTLTES